MRPEDIERTSMEIIDREMRQEWGEWRGDPAALPVVYRVIHTTADFAFAKNLYFSEDVIAKAREALRHGVTIVTDTNMLVAGISKRAASQWKVPLVCYMADPDVAEEAKARGVTRAVVSMEHAVRETPNAVFVIGNAPTALIRLCELIREGKAQPAAVVGVPVGFVNVVESKEMLRTVDVPQIVAMGRKGGSTVGVSIVNALLYGLD